MLPRQLELEDQLEQLAQEMRRRDDQLGRAKRRLVAKEAENEQLKKQLALAAQELQRVVPLMRHAPDPPRGDQLPATPTRSKSRQPVAGGKGRTESQEKPIRRSVSSGTRFLAANLAQTPSTPSPVPAKGQPKVVTDKNKVGRGPVRSEASEAGAAGGRRLPNEGASLEARRSSLALSHYPDREAPPETPVCPPTPLVGFLQSLLCRVAMGMRIDLF